MPPGTPAQWWGCTLDNVRRPVTNYSPKDVVVAAGALKHGDAVARAPHQEPITNIGHMAFVVARVLGH